MDDFEDELNGMSEPQDEGESEEVLLTEEQAFLVVGSQLIVTANVVSATLAQAHELIERNLPRTEENKEMWELVKAVGTANNKLGHYLAKRLSQDPSCDVKTEAVSTSGVGKRKGSLGDLIAALGMPKMDL